MSFKHVARIVCSLFLILTATQLYASESDTERVFDWAESQYPSLFTPAAQTQSLDTWQFRYYSATNVYIGINNGTEVYLLGEIFGGLMYVASVSDLLQLLPDSDDEANPRIVAGTGMKAADFPEGYIYWSVAKPGMGPNGQIAFSGVADVSIYSTDNNTNAVWSGFPGSLKAIAKENDTISGLPANVLFDGKRESNVSEPPVVTSSGNVAFMGYLKGAVNTSTSGAILAWVDGTLKSVLRLGDQAPGFSTGTLVYQLNGFRFSDSGMVIFGLTSKNQPALWYWNYETVTLLAAGFKSQFEAADEEAIFPIEGCDYGYFGMESIGTDFFINDNGDIIVDVMLETMDTKEGCPKYSSVNMKGSKAVIVAQSDENFPLNSGETFTRWTTESLNLAGGISIRAIMGSTVSSWYQPADGEPRLVVLSGEYIPESYTESLLYNLITPYSITCSSERSVVYGTVLNGTNGVAESILAGNPRATLPYSEPDQAGNSHLSLVAKTYMQPPDFEATSFFSDLGEPKITSSGDILFAATIKSATDTGSTQSIWHVKPDNTMNCILRTGQMVEMDGAQKSVSWIYFDESDTDHGIGSGKPGVFSDTNQLVLRTRFSGSSNDYIMTLSYE